MTSNDRLIFTKQAPHCLRAETHPTIRVNGQVYDFLVHVCEKTGLSMATVASSMLEFAAARTEIVDYCPALTSKSDCCLVRGK